MPITCYAACFKLAHTYFFSFSVWGASLQPKSYTSGVNVMSGVLELSEASIESSGAKAAACGTLSVLASLSNKGTYFC
jgi:hypothetical protein